MAASLSPGAVLKDTYIIKKVSFEGRFYIFYTIEEKSNPGIPLQLTEFLIPKLHSRQAKMSEEEFIAAVDLLKGLKDPHIPAIMDGFFHEGNACMVLAQDDGISLEKYLDMQVKPFTVNEALEKIKQCADTLNYLYTRPSPIPFTHIDTPLVCIKSNGTISFTGFGLHLFIDHYLASTDPNAFCAPEIIEGKPFSIQAAIYSLGALLYYMTTKRKWNGSRKDNPPPREIAAEIPEAFQQVLVKALSRSPDQRFLELNGFIRKLEEALNPPEKVEAAVVAQAVAKKEETFFDADLSSLKKKMTIAGLVIAGVVLAIILIISYMHYNPGKKTFSDADFAYILGGDRKSVKCINLKSDAPGRSMALLGECESVTLSGDGKRFYLSCADKTIKVVDAKGKVMATYPLEKIPAQVFLSPDGPNAFVAVKDEPVMLMWNPATGAVEKKIATTSSPYMAVMSLNGKYVYVLDRQKAQVTVIDGKNGSVISSFAVVPEPEDIAVEKTDSYLLISSLDGNVNIYDTQYYSLIKSVAVEKGIIHIASSRGKETENQIYLACEEGKSVYKLDFSSFLLSKKTFTEGTPLSLKTGPEGKILYVLCGNPDALLLLSADNLKEIKSISTGIAHPAAMEVWPQ